MDTHEKMEDFWNTCPEEFANLKEFCTAIVDIDWDEHFVDRLNDLHPIANAKVADYGPGGGWFGIFLHQVYGLDQYAAIDIARRQLIHTRSNILKANNDKFATDKLGFTLLYSDVEFKDIDADIFVSQACIQHFPDLDYLNDFLENVNTSKIRTVVLQYRYDETTHIKNDSFKNAVDVCYKCYTNEEYITRRLPNYRRHWVGPLIEDVQGKYAIFSHKLKVTLK